MYKLDLEKAEEPEVKLPTSVVSKEKQGNNFFKKIYFCFFDYAKAFDCVSHNKKWKILKGDGNTRPPYLSPKKPAYRFLRRQVRWSGIPIF